MQAFQKSVTLIKLKHACSRVKPRSKNSSQFTQSVSLSPEGTYVGMGMPPQ